jgi:alpha-galactosidase/6-phospho-beta-glucosidase family protein
MKLAVIGGGSTYTPELVDGLIRMRDHACEDAEISVDREAVGG